MAQYLDETGLKLLWGATKSYVEEAQKIVSGDIEEIGQKALKAHLDGDVFLVRRSGGPNELYSAKQYISVGDMINASVVEKVALSEAVNNAVLEAHQAVQDTRRVWNAVTPDLYASSTTGTCTAIFSRCRQLIVVLTVTAGGKEVKSSLTIYDSIEPDTGATRYSCRIAGADTYVDADHDADTVTVGKVMIDGKEQTPKIDVYYTY